MEGKNMISRKYTPHPSTFMLACIRRLKSESYLIPGCVNSVHYYISSALHAVTQLSLHLLSIDNRCIIFTIHNNSQL